MENIYYVYAYLDPTKPIEENNLGFIYEPFYIGKGMNYRSKIHLQNYKLKKKTHLSNRINKIKSEGLEPIVIKLFENLQENEALNIEINLIKTIGRRTLKTGTLVNITNGGEGVSGLKHSVESRMKMSQKGDKHPNWGKNLSDETRSKISERLKANNPMKNTEVSEKVRLKNIGREPWNKGKNTPEDVCKKLSEKKIKYYDIELISKENGLISKFDNIYKVMEYLEKCYRSVYLYLKKGECKDYFIKYNIN
jgi:group I intron endonuclease